MNPISSADEAKRVARPEGMCSMRPWMVSDVSVAAAVRCTTKADLADSGARFVSGIRSFVMGDTMTDPGQRSPYEHLMFL